MTEFIENHFLAYLLLCSICIFLLIRLLAFVIDWAFNVWRVSVAKKWGVWGIEEDMSRKEVIAILDKKLEEFKEQHG